MGSQAQDARHERMLKEAKDRVFHLERQIESVKAQLEPLEEELAAARRDLEIEEAIDRRRD